MPRARPEAVQAPADVELIKGKPANIDDLRMAPEGTDAAISVLNNARASDNPWGRPITTAESTRPSTPCGAQLVTTGRRRYLRLARTWPRTDMITAAIARLDALLNPG